MGEEFVRNLLKQDLTLTRDDRQLADWLARGKFPIAIGVNDTDIAELQKLGVGAKVEPLGGEFKSSAALITTCPETFVQETISVWPGEAAL